MTLDMENRFTVDIPYRSQKGGLFALAQQKSVFFSSDNKSLFCYLTAQTIVRRFYCREAA